MKWVDRRRQYLNQIKRRRLSGAGLCSAAQSKFVLISSEAERAIEVQVAANGQAKIACHVTPRPMIDVNTDLKREAAAARGFRGRTRRRSCSSGRRASPRTPGWSA